MRPTSERGLPDALPHRRPTVAPWLATLFLTTIGLALASLASRTHAQSPTVTFSGFNDAAAGRCYEPGSTTVDPANGNRLLIGMVGCTVSAPNGTVQLMDTFRFNVQAPNGFFISRISFTQTGTSSGSRGGAGFRSATWVVDQTALPVTSGGSGWATSVDLSLRRRTSVPVSITTALAAFGIQVVSGSASASSPVVTVELAPLN